MNSIFLYIRGLRHAEHTVFCVDNGQKSYYENQFGKYVPFSSGQQVKRSILDTTLSMIGEQQAPITFTKILKKEGNKKSLGEGEPWSPCDPSYTDQLLGGWMRAQSGYTPVKRRSPLSISAMRALHPLLAGISRENITFDRSSNPDHHPVKVRDEKGNVISEEELQKFLKEEKRELTRRNYIQNLTRANGLFLYDVAIDLRTLFTVSLNKHEREITDKIEENLRYDGWVETKNAFGSCLVCPEDKRKVIISALAYGLINWRITSNQARTFSLMETLAVTISDNANEVASAIRAKLDSESEQPKAIPIIDESIGTHLYVTTPCEAYIQGVNTNVNALKEAVQKIDEMLNNYNYEKQTDS